MKKLMYASILLLSIFMFPWNTYAAGGYSVSSANVNLTKGGSTTITISVTNAAGRIDISSSNSGVASVSNGSFFVDAYQETRVYSFNITANASGSAIITVTPRDMATYDKEVISYPKQIRVNVSDPVVKPNNPTPTPTVPSGPADTRSTNTSLKNLTVNGKNLTNNNNIFTLEVSNYIEKVDIVAVAQDNKAKVTGNGSKGLNVGENKFNIVVTAERGNSTTYTVNVIRKEYNSLNDLDELLKLNGDYSISISNNDVLTKEQLEKIIKSKKLIILNKRSEDDKNILYSFILDGSKISSVEKFNPNITTILEDNSKMEEALNYADGIYFDFSKCLDIPKGVILKYYVGDKYKDNTEINLYVYSENKVTQLKEGILVSNGFIEFEVTKSIKHFITRAKVVNADVEAEGINLWMICSFVLAGIVIVLVGLIIINKVKMANINKGVQQKISSIHKRTVEDVRSISNEENEIL